MSKTKQQTKKTNNKIVDIINTPRTIIIFLIVVLMVLCYSFMTLKGHYKFYSGQISANDMAVAEIHYYSEPTMTYFFANNAVYGGEDKRINNINVKYTVTVDNKEVIIDQVYAEFEKPQSLIQMILVYSKFKVVDLKGKTNTIFTNEVKKNITTMKLVIDADDNHLEYPVILSKLK